METANRLSKLTEREKECLRLWLARKTAKEIALDIGVSHHAVEKRLKMARVKLGVGSSLEAARWLAQEEGYGRSVAQPPDLPAAPLKRDHWVPRPIVLGGIAMTLLSVLAAMMLNQTATETTIIDAATPDGEKVAAMTRRTFDGLDENTSGFLEQPESPFVSMVFLEEEDSVSSVGASNIITITKNARTTPDQVRTAQFYAKANRDGDGRISYPEYHDWSVPRLAALSIDLVDLLKPES